MNGGLAIMLSGAVLLGCSRAPRTAVATPDPAPSASILTTAFFRLDQVNTAGAPTLSKKDRETIRRVSRRFPPSKRRDFWYTFAGAEGRPPTQFIIVDTEGQNPEALSHPTGSYANLRILNLPCIEEFNPRYHTIFTATSC
jgi:hypothetical protein